MRAYARGLWSHALAIVSAVAALAIAALWLFTTPIFAEPDEQAHLDYALTIADEGLPLAARQRRIVTDSDRTLRYLEDKLHYRELRFDSTYRVDPSWSSPEARAAIDRGLEGGSLDVRMRRTIPSIAPNYPAGYYGLAAFAYIFSRHILHFGVIESVYAMRLLSLVALMLTLSAAYVIYLELGFSRLASALAMAAIGIFPLVSWVFAMVQPDTFTAAGVTLALLFILRIRRRPNSKYGYAWLTFIVAALAFVKLQYAALTICGLIPALFSLYLRAPSFRRGALVAATISLSSIALALSAALLPHPRGGSAHFTGHLFRDPYAWLVDLKYIFFDGVAHTTFWSSRDWFDTKFFFNDSPMVDQFTALAGSIAIALVAITVLRDALKLSEFAVRHPRLAAAVALSDSPLVLYLVWTIGLIVLDLSFPGRIGLLGRYWLPVLVPLLAILMRSVARARFPRQRVRVSTVVAGVWLAYALLAAPFAFAQMHQRFFSAQGPRNPFARRVTVERIWDSQGRKFDTEEMTIAYGSKLCFRGVAIDSRYGVLDRGVAVKVDGQLTNLRSGIPRSYPANVFNDDALINIGFEGCIPPRVLTVGHHEARLEVFARDGTALLWPPHLHVTVVRSPRFTGG